MTFQRTVDVVDIRVVVLSVVNFHCSRIDVWLERVMCIGKFRKFERHDVHLLRGASEMAAPLGDPAGTLYELQAKQQP